jgi:hypothetical protein
VSGRLTDHLAIGVLTGLIHRDIVDDVIRECGKREKRSRLLQGKGKFTLGSRCDGP